MKKFLLFAAVAALTIPAASNLHAAGREQLYKPTEQLKASNPLLNNKRITPVSRKSKRNVVKRYSTQAAFSNKLLETFCKLYSICNPNAVNMILAKSYLANTSMHILGRGDYEKMSTFAERSAALYDAYYRSSNGEKGAGKLILDAKYGANLSLTEITEYITATTATEFDYNCEYLKGFKCMDKDLMDKFSSAESSFTSLEELINEGKKGGGGSSAGGVSDIGCAICGEKIGSSPYNACSMETVGDGGGDDKLVGANGLADKSGSASALGENGIGSSKNPCSGPNIDCGEENNENEFSDLFEKPTNEAVEGMAWSRVCGNSGSADNRPPDKDLPTLYNGNNVPNMAPVDGSLSPADIGKPGSGVYKENGQLYWAAKGESFAKDYSQKGAPSIKITHHADIPLEEAQDQDTGKTVLIQKGSSGSDKHYSSEEKEAATKKWEKNAQDIATGWGRENDEIEETTKGSGGQFNPDASGSLNEVCDPRSKSAKKGLDIVRNNLGNGCAEPENPFIYKDYSGQTKTLKDTAGACKTFGPDVLTSDDYFSMSCNSRPDPALFFKHGAGVTDPPPHELINILPRVLQKSVNSNSREIINNNSLGDKLLKSGQQLQNQKTGTFKTMDK